VVRLRSLTLLASDDEEAGDMRSGADVGRAVAEGENLARELAAKPGNVATPSHLARIARQIAEEGGMEITVMGRDELAEGGFGGILAVAAGTEEEPQFIILEYRGGSADSKPLALVGKGVTFDTGGISIKPAAKMEEMKYDMAGAAAVLGAMQAVARLRPRANVVALVPCTDNMPSGRAIKPGDVITMYSGKTVEVINTDAEGRLLLADALAYSLRYEPQAIIDAATLTGAIVMALGHEAVGFMGNNGDLIDQVRAVGSAPASAAGRCLSGTRTASSSTATWRTSRTWAGDPPAPSPPGGSSRSSSGTRPGSTWTSPARRTGTSRSPSSGKGPTGVPTRLFIEWIRERADR
jgi:leucyl aminopeptidase